MAKGEIDLRTVAVIHRQLQWGIGAVLALLVGGLVVRWLWGPGTVFSRVGEYVWYGLHLYGYVQTIRLMRTIQSRWAYTIAAGVVMLFGFVWFLVAELVCCQAAILLKGAGLKVGQLGVRSKELFKLQEGVCDGCGYAQIGLDGTKCPECGMEKPLATG